MVKKMKKWALAGMLYFTAVILGFLVYDNWIAEEKETTAHTGMNSMENTEKTDDMEDKGDTEHNRADTESVSHDGAVGEGSHGHGADLSDHEGSQVNAFINHDQNNLKIFLKDKAGNPIDDLEVNHEKILHLIIVDEKLQKYYHLHPDQTGKGEFTIVNSLTVGYYKAFIDIKPKSHAYEVEPVPFVVGNPKSIDHGHGLEPDTILSEKVDGEDVTLDVSTFKAGEDVTLSFSLDKTNLTPYLGAMGHVVILDEYGKKFLHVHPSNDKEPIFETTFDKPGIYKIWAEFQQNGKVRAFPFVIEVKE